MQLIHTADWHLGRRLKGVDRTPEIAQALDRLLDDARTLAVDAVLVAGDLFDAPNPPAEAERVAYRFFAGLNEAGIPAVVIAGNHDSASRLDGIAGLLGLAGIRALGRPRSAHGGGVIAVPTAHGLLRVAALPFASERRLLTADELWDLSDEDQRRHYREMVARLLRNLVTGFDGDSVNVLMAHLAIDGAKLAHSEAAFYTTGAYSLAEAVLPGEAQYIALGHIHTRQQIQAAAPTYYAGSVIQVDFAEADEIKGYNLIEVEPGRPAKVTLRDLPCTRPLVRVFCRGDNLEDTLEPYREHVGFLKIVVDLEGPMLGLAARVRKVCPQALVIEPRYPEAPKDATAREAVDLGQIGPLEGFRRFYLDRQGTVPRPEILAAFGDLFEEHVHGHEAPSGAKAEPAHAPA